MRIINQIIQIILYLCLPLLVTAQSYQFDWVTKLQLNAPGFEKTMVLDKDDNIYLSGGFRGNLDFNPGAGVNNLTSADVYKDIFLLKLDAESNFQWAKNIGKEGVNETMVAINTDGDGNVYLIGTFNGTLDFDPGPGVFNMTSVRDTDYFILKLDAAGDFQWAKQIKDNNKTVLEIAALDFDANGNIFVYGGFVGDFDFDPGPNVENLITSNSSLFVLKLTNTGEFIWVKGILGTSIVLPNQLRVDAEDNILITGRFTSGKLLIDPNNSAVELTCKTGNKDIFIEKLDNDGNYLWAKQIERKTLDYDTTLDIDFDALGNVYTIGAFQGTIDLDSGPNLYNLSATTTQDVFIQKLDKNGNFKWAHQIKGDTEMAANSLDVNEAGNIFVTGDFLGEIYFDCNCSQQKLVNALTNNLSRKPDYFVLSLDAMGEYQWIHRGGANGQDMGFSVACNTVGDLITMGKFTETVDFDPSSAVSTLFTFSNRDEIFIQKMQPCTPNKTQITPVIACNSYIGIGGAEYFETGTYREFLENSAGCDSIVSFDLMIQEIDVEVSTENETLAAKHANAQYQWLDCQNNFEAISGATNQQFIPTDARDFAVEISINDCKDTSACYSVNPTLGLATNLKAHFPFKGEAIDISGNAHPTTINGNVALTSDRDNNSDCAYGFDGSVNSYISIAPAADFNIAPTGYLSISLWYQGGGALGPYKYLFGKKEQQTVPRTFDFTLGLHDLNNPVFEEAWGQIDPPHPDNTWRHLVGIYKNGNSFLYVDNVLVDVSENFPFTPNMNEIIIGQNFEGKIDDIRFYNRAISETEIDMLYNMPADCFLTTSIENKAKLLSPVVYPNPTNGSINIDFGAVLKTTTVSITSIIGHTVFTASVQNQESIAIDMTDFSKGLYFIQIDNGLSQSTLKIIKE